METTALTLSAFLLARIEEDEAWANSPGDWNEYDPGDPSDPARVLNECAAKRGLMALADIVLEHGKSDETATDLARTSLRVLAAVYVDHPDFNPDWV